MKERLVRLAVVAAVVAGVVLAISLVPGEIRWDAAWERRWLFRDGLLMTALISFGALVLGLLFGACAGLARVSSSPSLDQAALTYVELVRGTPFLVQLYILYWCIARALELRTLFESNEALVVGIVGLGLFAGAYIAEIVRAGVESIDRGQWEAARSLGLSHSQALFRVILPQAAGRMIPPLTGEAVSLVKESSLLSVIGVAEMTYHAKNLASATFETFAAYLPLAALYLGITLPLSFVTRLLERRLRPPAHLPVTKL